MRKLDKSVLNYFIDLVLTITFIITGITGLVIFFFIPSGVQQGRFQVFLGIQKQVWTAWHNWSGIVMILAVLLHLVLHWNWMIRMTKKILRIK